MDDSYCEPKIDLPRWAEQCAAPGGVVRGRSEGDVTQKPEEGRRDTWVRPNLGQPANQSLVQVTSDSNLPSSEKLIPSASAGVEDADGKKEKRRQNTRRFS